MRSISPQVKSRLWWFSLVVLLVVVDYVSKLLALHFFEEEPVKLLPFFSFECYCNPGAAFGFLVGFPKFLMLFSVVASILFAILIYRVPYHRFWLGLAFTGILAGAIGNLIDRILRGCVIDFLHFYIGDLSYPIFNFADSFITLGAITWLLVHVLHKEKVSTESEAEDSEAS